MKILDLFCGVGGSAMGIHRVFPRAEIVGVDLKEQPRYPFTFIRADALKFDDGGFDIIWASPPCQRYTQMLNHGLTNRDKHPDLVAKTRRKLIKSGLPWVMENVPNSPLRKDLVLCGEMFGLRVTRHRVFECNFLVPQPKHIPHRGTGIRNQKGSDGNGRGGVGQGSAEVLRDCSGCSAGIRELYFRVCKEVNYIIPQIFADALRDARLDEAKWWDENMVDLDNPGAEQTAKQRIAALERGEA